MLTNTHTTKLNRINYCARGAMPLAFPKRCPATMTGTLWFPAAMEAVCLYLRRKKKNQIPMKKEKDRKQEVHHICSKSYLKCQIKIKSEMSSYLL